MAIYTPGPERERHPPLEEQPAEPPHHRALGPRIIRLGVVTFIDAPQQSVSAPIYAFVARLPGKPAKCATPG